MLHLLRGFIRTQEYGQKQALLATAAREAMEFGSSIDPTEFCIMGDEE